MGIHGEEMPLDIEHRDAIVTAFNETSGELLASPEGFFEMGSRTSASPCDGARWVGGTAVKSSTLSDYAATNNQTETLCGYEHA